MSKYLDSFTCARIATNPSVYKKMPEQWYTYKNRRLPWFCISQKMRDTHTRDLMRELNLTDDDLEDFKMPKPRFPRAGDIVFGIGKKVPACYDGRYKLYDEDLLKLV